MLGWAMLYGALIDAGFAWAIVGPPVFERAPRSTGSACSISAWSPRRSPSGSITGSSAQVGPARAAYSSVLIPIIAMAHLHRRSRAIAGRALAIAGGLLAIAGLLIALGAPPDRGRRPSRE